MEDKDTEIKPKTGLNRYILVAIAVFAFIEIGYVAYLVMKQYLLK